MPDDRILTYYLHDQLRQRAERGGHNFINRINRVVRAAGFDIAYLGHDPDTLQQSVDRPGYAMFHMSDPLHDRALTMRKVYEFPFWNIADTAKRWEWPVSMADFTPCPDTPRQEMDRFYRFWSKRQFGDAPQRAQEDGYVYVPLQGRLLDHRSFQTCSPISMIQAVLEHEPRRKVIATLHPKETYAQAELTALERLESRYPRLEIAVGGMVDLLANCDYVVTQNSSAGFAGFFFGKPLVLFGRIDFHHIAANVHRTGVARALEMAPQLRPDYAAYIYWFWQKMSINAGIDGAEGKIRDRLLTAGWPLGAR
ncbi:hypothetical protein K3727_00935 [Rhodobacteraceae bacterium M382]|nr:hypothetical protein K3727_00935 [Rhodobacteraceae bacterium M382]